MSTKVLYISSNPVKTERLETERERREVLHVMRGTPGSRSLEILSVPAARFRDIRRALHEHQPAIVYFTGHGTIKNTLVLEDDTGGSREVGPPALAGLLAEFVGHVKVVILNACLSDPLAEEVAKHVDCAIGMAEPIRDSAGRAFAEAFFEALAFGRSVQRAFNLGKNAFLACGTPEHVPKLFEREAGLAQKTTFAPARPRVHPVRLVSIAVILAMVASLVLLGRSLIGHKGAVEPAPTQHATAFQPPEPAPLVTSPEQPPAPAPSPPATKPEPISRAPSARVSAEPAASTSPSSAEPTPTVSPASGDARCSGETCYVSLDGGTFDGSFRAVCVSAAADGVPVRCLLRNDAKGRSAAACDRTDAHSVSVLVNGTFRWKRCDG